MRLGPRVSHHYAHRPGAACALREGESALHYNAKLWLAAELRRALERDPASPPLLARFPCSYVPDWGAPEYIPYCQTMHSAAWADGWDGVEVERAIGSRRPEVLLTRGGRPCAAIEILVSHAVDEEKAADLRAFGVPWVEIPAERILPTGDAPWRHPRPLPTSGAGEPGDWLCKAHAEEKEAAERIQREREKKREERQQRWEAEQQRRRKEAETERRIQERIASAERREWLARVLDVYLPDGTLRRERWVMEATIRDGRVFAVQLFRAHVPTPVARYLSAGVGSRRQAAGTLNQAFLQHVEGERRYSGALVEIATRWTPVSQLSPADADALPLRFGWHEGFRRWVGRESE